MHTPDHPNFLILSLGVFCLVFSVPVELRLASETWIWDSNPEGECIVCSRKRRLSENLREFDEGCWFNNPITTAPHFQVQPCLKIGSFREDKRFTSECYSRQEVSTTVCAVAETRNRRNLVFWNNIIRQVCHSSGFM
jgi:hypothetical protein